MKKKKILVGTALISLLVGMCSTVYGAWSITGATTNYVSTATFGSKVLEDYEEPERVMPGEYVARTINVQNVGETESLVHVKLSSKFKDETLSDSNVVLDVDKDHWYTKDDENYYYKGTLTGGEVTKYPILRGYTVVSGSDNAYESQEVKTQVDVETMQYFGGFISIWGISYSDLGLPDPTDEFDKNYESSVTFTKDKEFIFNGSSKDDLFADLKGLLPGSTRTQVLSVTNDSGTDTDLSISYMMSNDSSESLKDLMNKYVTITVRDKNGKVTYNGPISGEGASIKLGSFEKGESKKVTVTASVDPNMSEQYSQLKGSVEWGFLADEIPHLVKTSDDFKKYIYMGIGLVVLGMIMLVISEKGKRRNESIK